MATAYTAATYADIQINAPWGVGQCWVRPFSFAMSAAFVINDTVKLCPIWAKDQSVLVVGYEVEIPPLDSAGSPTVLVSLGDTNGASGAFQATFLATGALGSGSGVSAVISPVMAFNGTTAVAPVRGVVPKQYGVAQLYSGFVAFPTIDFMLKITTAPTTGTTSGTIKGWLMLQTLNQSVATF